MNVLRALLTERAWIELNKLGGTVEDLRERANGDLEITIARALKRPNAVFVVPAGEWEREE